MLPDISSLYHTLRSLLIFFIPPSYFHCSAVWEHFYLVAKEKSWTCLLFHAYTHSHSLSSDMDDILMTYLNVVAQQISFCALTIYAFLMPQSIFGWVEVISPLCFYFAILSNTTTTTTTTTSYLFYPFLNVCESFLCLQKVCGQVFEISSEDHAHQYIVRTYMKWCFSKKVETITNSDCVYHRITIELLKVWIICILSTLSKQWDFYGTIQIIINCRFFVTWLSFRDCTLCISCASL